MPPVPPAIFFEPEDAERLLAQAETLWPPGAPRDVLLAACAAAADPDRALGSLFDVAEGRARRLPRGPVPWHDPRWLHVVGSLAGASRAFAGALRRRPRLPERLCLDPFRDLAKPGELMAAELRRQTAALPPDAPDLLQRLQRVLRRYRLRELMRITLRDLAGAPLPEVAAEISDLAAAALAAALPPLYARLLLDHGAPPADPESRATTPGFCVLAMGKLGGRELNPSSDIDVIYVYERDGETAGGRRGAVTAFQFHVRLAELLGRALGEVTGDGLVFRVDAGLRPEGRSGPLACSIRSFEAYYEAFGRAWERQALLKAEPIAGDLDTGRRALEAISPFVYRRSLDLGAVRSVARLKDELDAQTRQKGIAESDLKLGRGGIREVEFVVQSLQLLQAGKDDRLRVRATLPALERLLFAGHLDEEDVRALSDAYVFLRRTEHRVQTVDDRQTHRLPPPGRARATLARSMGFTGPDAEEAFEAVLEEHRQRVEWVFARRFGPPEAHPEVEEAFRVLARPDTDDAAREQLLAETGFADPHAAVAHLRRLGRRPMGLLGHSRRAEAATLAPLLLADCARSPDPDAALMHLSEFFYAMPRAVAPGYHELLLKHAPARRLLVSLFGTSDFLARDFLRHPELIDGLILRSYATVRKDAHALGGEITERLVRHAPDDAESRLSELRRIRQEEILRIGLNDVSETLTLPEVLEQLSVLAEHLLAANLTLAADWARRRWGVPRTDDGEEVPLCVVGMGKLGGREMGYGSDLDLVFVHGGAGETDGGDRGRIDAQEYYVRLTQRLVSYLTLPLPEGALYAIDTRLRPSGRQGTLVTSLEAFRAYHAASAEVWERQALTRARPVAGHAAFQPVVADALSEAAWRSADPEALRVEIARVRARMQQELAGEDPDRYNPKKGRGGLVDVEFTVQYLQLRDGPSWPSTRRTGILEALDALVEAGRLPAADADVLRHGYVFLRRLENRLRIVHDRPIEHMPRGGRSLETLARRMGYHGGDGLGAGESLLTEYRDVTRAVRRVYDRVFGAHP